MEGVYEGVDVDEGEDNKFDLSLTSRQQLCFVSTPPCRSDCTRTTVGSRVYWPAPPIRHRNPSSCHLDTATHTLIHLICSPHARHASNAHLCSSLDNRRR
jgi:hypothetical protein